MKPSHWNPARQVFLLWLFLLFFFLRFIRFVVHFHIHAFPIHAHLAPWNFIDQWSNRDFIFFVPLTMKMYKIQERAFFFYSAFLWWSCSLNIAPLNHLYYIFLFSLNIQNARHPYSLTKEIYNYFVYTLDDCYWRYMLSPQPSIHWYTQNFNSDEYMNLYVHFCFVRNIFSRKCG